jgi:hypothetical protein
MAHDDAQVLPHLPEVGYYHHYKHDPNGAVNIYAYFVFNVGYHTEDDCRPIDQWSVDYLPLYDAFVYRLGKGRVSDSRPLEMFMSKVVKDGIERERFARITDPKVIKQLEATRKQMYPDR